MQNLKPGQCVGCARLIPDSVISFPMDCERHIVCERCMNSRKITSFVCPTQFCSSSSSSGGGGAGNTSTPPQQESSSSSQGEQKTILQARMEARYNEPLKPLSMRQSAVAAACASVLNTIGSLVDRNKPDSKSRDPRVLLDQRIPLTKLVKEHGFHITELINDHGITINDFFERGYTMSHLCDAFSARLNHKDGLAVLYALGISVDHFTMVPQYVQETVMRERLGYDPSWLLKFGYRFEPNKHTLAQLVGLGLTMPMVMDAGMRTKSQWEYLKRTSGATRNDVAKFGCTPQLEAELLLDLPLDQQQQQQYYGQQQQGAPVVANNNNSTWIAGPMLQQQQPYQENPPFAGPVVVRAIDPRSYREEEEVHENAKSSSGVPRLRTPAEIQKQSAPRLVVLKK